MKVAEEATVAVPPAELYDLYADLSRWPDVLDDIEAVEVHYQDGYHQEFSMVVTRPGGRETVRGVRYCRNRELEMCQFDTPPALTRMTGRWTFSGPPEGPTQLRAERTFTMREPDADAEAFATQLGRYLRENLRAFGQAACDAHR